MATKPSDIMDSVAARVVAATHTPRHPGDAFRRVETAKDLLGRDRQFVVRPLTVPVMPDDIIGSSWRDMQIQITMHYADSRGVHNRAADDSMEIAEELERLMIDVAAVMGVEVVSFDLDDTGVEGAVLAEYTLNVRFDKDV